MKVMDYLENLEAGGFMVVRREIPAELPAGILARFGNIPAGYLAFLKQFELITNREDTVWFNSIEDFNGDSETDFGWNAFELMSLDAFEDDESETEKIIHFWNNHLPVLMSVIEYEYLAICLENDRYGEIVHGLEPLFEETTKVCDNFEQLIILLEKPSGNSNLKHFVSNKNV